MGGMLGAVICYLFVAMFIKTTVSLILVMLALFTTASCGLVAFSSEIVISHSLAGTETSFGYAFAFCVLVSCLLFLLLGLLFSLRGVDKSFKVGQNSSVDEGNEDGAEWTKVKLDDE